MKLSVLSRNTARKDVLWDAPVTLVGQSRMTGITTTLDYFDTGAPFQTLRGCYAPTPPGAPSAGRGAGASEWVGMAWDTRWKACGSAAPRSCPVCVAPNVGSLCPRG